MLTRTSIFQRGPVEHKLLYKNYTLLCWRCLYSAVYIVLLPLLLLLVLLLLSCLRRRMS